MTTRNRRVTDPYDRWCGGRELESPAYPILLLEFFEVGLKCSKFIYLKAALVDISQLFKFEEEI